MVKKSSHSKKTKVEDCPPAIAEGVKTTAEVKPIKRPKGKGPRKLIKKKPRLKKKKGRTKKWVDPEPAVSTKPKRPNHLPWTTKSRRIQNERKDRMARRKRLSPATKKRLEAANKRRMKRLRRRLHDLFTHD